MIYLCTQLVRDDNIWHCFDVNHGKRGLQIFQINMDIRKCYDDISQNFRKYEIENTNIAKYYHTSTNTNPGVIK